MLKRIEEPDTMTITFPVPGQMYVYIDPIDNTWAGPTDGSFTAVQSPMSPPGMTTAFRTVGSKNDVRNKTWRENSLPRHP